MRSKVSVLLALSLFTLFAQNAFAVTLNAACEKYRPACVEKKYFGLIGRHISACIWASARKAKDEACLAPARKQVQAARAGRSGYTWKLGTRKTSGGVPNRAISR